MGASVTYLSFKKFLDSDEIAMKMLAGYATYCGLSWAAFSAILTKYLLNYKKELLNEAKNKENKIELTRKEK